MAMDAMLGLSAFGLSQGLQRTQDRQRGLAGLGALQGLASAQLAAGGNFTSSNFIVVSDTNTWDRAVEIKTKTKTLVEELQADVDEWLPKL